MSPKRLTARFRKSIVAMGKLLMYAGAVTLLMMTLFTYYPDSALGPRGNWLLVGSYLLSLFVFGRVYGAFNIGAARVAELLYSGILTLSVVNVLMYLQFCLNARELVSPLWLGLSTLAQMAYMGVLTLALHRLYLAIFPLRDVIAICRNPLERETFFQRTQLHEKYVVKEIISADSTLGELLKQIEDYHSVMLCDLSNELTHELLVYCYAHEKRVYILPDVPQLLINQGSFIQIFDTPLLQLKNKSMDLEQVVIKRAMDILISGLLLLLAFVPCLLIGLLIKCTDGGHVFYTQKRVTKGGKIFRLIKFRSMVADAESGGAIKSTGATDPRVTWIGKFIRPTRIDEIPQLLNVLGGSMSLVGPRPERVENVAEYSALLPEFTLRLKVKAGLTGYAQVYGKYNTSPRDKLNMDLYYIERYSLWRDVLLLIMTPKVLLLQDSTEGFDPIVDLSEQVAANQSVRQARRQAAEATMQPIPVPRGNPLPPEDAPGEDTPS